MSLGRSQQTEKVTATTHHCLTTINFYIHLKCKVDVSVDEFLGKQRRDCFSVYGSRWCAWTHRALRHSVFLILPGCFYHTINDVMQLNRFFFLSLGSALNWSWQQCLCHHTACVSIHPFSFFNIVCFSDGPPFFLFCFFGGASRRG